MDDTLPPFVVRISGVKLRGGRFAEYGKRVAILQTREGATKFPSMISTRDKSVKRIVFESGGISVRGKKGGAELFRAARHCGRAARVLSQMVLAVKACEIEGEAALKALVKQVMDETGEG